MATDAVSDSLICKGTLAHQEGMLQPLLMGAKIGNALLCLKTCV